MFAHRRRAQGGQVLPLLAVIVLLAGVLALGIARVGTRAVGRARAQAAADAAALAGVDGGPGAAGRAASANDGVLTRFVATPGGAYVEVAVAGERASAQAAHSDPLAAVVAPAIRAALARAAQVLGTAVVAMQSGGGGLVVEVAPPLARRLAGLGDQTGLCPVPGRAPGWFEICPVGAR